MNSFVAKFGYGYNYKALFAPLPDIELIFDRTQEDVDRVKLLNQKYQNGTITEVELAEWNGNLKGALNKSDLTRILFYMNYFAENLSIALTPQTLPEIPRESWYETLHDNLELLRSNYSTHETTPEVPDNPFNTYQKWNDIEKILYDLYDIYSNQNIYYCGDELYGNNILI